MDFVEVPPLRFPEFSGEWNRTSIGDKFELYSGNTPSRLEKDQFVGKINWITSGELKNHYIAATNETITEEAAANNNLRLLPIGTFVIAIYGLEAAGVRSTGSITTEASTISQACMAFLPKGEISNEFLYSWYMKHGNIIGLRYAQGTKQQNLSYDIIERFKISYPNVLEQRKLEKFISLLDRRIAIQSGLINKLESLIGGIRRKLFDEQQNCKLCRLGDFLVEYSERNMNRNLTSVAVGKYGIRKREDIYSRELSKDYSKNKVIKKNTLTIGMGSSQIDIGVLLEDVEYCVSPAYTTYKIHGINSAYLQEYLILINPILSFKYMVTSVRQGKSVNKDELMKHKISVCSLSDQQKIQLAIAAFYKKLGIEQQVLDLYIKQKQYLLSQMFI